MPQSPANVLVPAIVQAKAAAVPGGEEWLRGLSRLVGDLERSWDVTLTSILPGGTASFVARTMSHDGQPAVIKVAVPGSEFARQVNTLNSARGDGYVRVLRHAPEHDAVLLEALGPSLHQSGLPPTNQLAVMARLLRRAWQVTPSPEFGRPQNKAAGLADFITGLWESLSHPCEKAVVEHALTCAERRSAAFDPATIVVVHGDAATANAARVPQARPGAVDDFVLLDPAGFVGDPVYDLGVALRDWCSELLTAITPAAVLDDYCRVLAQEANVDPVAVWEWGYAERVSTGLYALSLGADGASHLRTAEVLLAGEKSHLRQ